MAIIPRGQPAQEREHQWQLLSLRVGYLTITKHPQTLSASLALKLMEYAHLLHINSEPEVRSEWHVETPLEKTGQSTFHDVEPFVLGGIIVGQHLF